ncbi:putative ABC transporter ATP-binding protein [uncultured archaeon]|nr:putative ABC transporter ATP-binding protein [uncultured archaeon]
MREDSCSREHMHDEIVKSLDKGTMIHTQGLCRIFEMGKNKVCALHDVGITIKKGEFVAIMGPSGSGKSTLLNHIGLLDTPTHGKIFLNGTDATGLSKEEKTAFRLNNLGFVFQFYNLIGELNALENTYIPRMLLGVDKKTCEKEALDILDVVGLRDRAMHTPAELSGGQQQRVAIARALINKPAILLADEPTANLDTKSGEHIVDTFRKLNRELGQTIVMVTHEPFLGKKADRIIWLKDGIISGKPTI